MDQNQSGDQRCFPVFPRYRKNGSANDPAPFSFSDFVRTVDIADKFALPASHFERFALPLSRWNRQALDEPDDPVDPLPVYPDF